MKPIDRNQPEMVCWTNLKWFFSSVNELVSLELGALNEGLAALSADVYARSVRVKMLPHRSIVSEQLAATLQH